MVRSVINCEPTQNNLRAGSTLQMSIECHTKLYSHSVLFLYSTSHTSLIIYNQK